MENIQLYLGFLILTITSYGQEDCHCPLVVYLQFRGKSKIPCRCDHFSLVSWYSSKEDYDDGSFPFITYDNSVTRGSGKTSGQFDLEQDGSLIINNVSIINHEMEYFSVFLRDTEGQTVKNRVKVEVIVPPYPLYPVLNGHMNHQYLYLHMKRQGTLKCSMKGVHPKVNLSITVIDQSHQGGVYLERDDTTYNPNEDNTYDVKVTYNYAADLSVQTSTLQCKVTGELGQQFSEVTTAEISFPPGEKAPSSLTPVIDGCNGKHSICMLKVQSEGELTCRVKNIHQSVELQWNIIDGYQWQVSLQKMEVAGDFITRSFQYEVKTLQTILIAECVTVDDTDERIPEASSKVVLVTEGDDMSRHGADVVLSWLTISFVSFFGLIGIILWYFNRKLYEETRQW